MKSAKEPGMLRRVCTAVACIAVLYVLIAELRFALRHPELTDTQRFLRMWDVLRWK